MSAVYLDYYGNVVAQSATPKAWLSTTGSGQTLTGPAGPAQIQDSFGGGTLIGGTGDDTFAIVDANEKINVAAGGGVDTVDAWASFILPANVNNLVLEAGGLTGTGSNVSGLLIAQGAGDILVAGSSGDVMVDGGAGGDFFSIGASASQDVIYGFQASGTAHDIIRLTGSGFASFADVESHLSQVGADTVLTLSTNQQVLLRNIQMSALTASDFALNINTANVTPTFDGEFNSLSLYNPTTGAGTWKTNFISGNQTGVESWMSRTLAPSSGEQELYVDPSYGGTGATPLGINPFSISNGVLTITATNTPTADLSALSGFKYTSGLLTTEKSFSQTYGYFEMKAELPAGQGVWPGFWLLPTDGSWPPELDVMEQIGGGTVYETSHFNGADGKPTFTGFSSFVPTDTTGFHTYGVLWTPTTLTWYVDGAEVASTATPADMNKPMYMLVNLAIGGTWPGSPPTNFTSASMEVDYIKAYSLASLGQNGSPPAPTPTAPSSSPDAYSAHAGAALTVNVANGVLANDVDHNGQALSAALAPNGGPSHGTLTLNANGSFTYTPTAGYAGTDSFTYIASDSASTGTPTTVTLTVGSSAPTSVADAYSAKAGAALSETAAHGVLANDVDNNGVALTAALATNGGPAHGSLALNADGSFTYTPTTGYAGTDSFTYLASDGLNTGAPTTVTLTIGATAPTTAATSYGVKVGVSLTETASQGVLAKDVDNNGLTLTAALASNGGPAHGTLALNADGSFTYTAATGFHGTDSFTYVASDGLSSSAPTTVTLNVSSAPIAVHSAAYSMRENSPLSVAAATGPLSFDTDNNGLALSATLATNGGPTHGALTLNADGSFSYTPNAGYYGTDSFSYVASDGVASAAPVTVSLKVIPLTPVSHTDYYTSAAGAALTVKAASGVLANDTDPNGLMLSAALAANGGPSHGSLVLNTDGSFTYTPNAGYVGTDSFKYVASDSAATGPVATVNLTVAAVAAVAPTGAATTYSATAGATLNVATIQGVLAHDVDNNGLSLTANLSSGPAHGALTLDANGSFSYTPTAGYVGTDSFQYIPKDALSTGTATTVTLNVSAVAAPSTATPSSQGTSSPTEATASESMASPTTSAAVAGPGWLAALQSLLGANHSSAGGPFDLADLGASSSAQAGSALATPNAVGASSSTSAIHLLGQYAVEPTHIGHAAML